MVQAALEIERQRTLQDPPVYSAIQTRGERAYALARRGVVPDLASRPVRVVRLDLTACGDEPAHLSVTLEVSKGYYVRAFARDLAATLGTAGHLTSLRRLRSGPFGLEHALGVDDSAEVMRSRLEPIAAAAARALPVAHLTPSGAEDARHGRRVQPTAIAAPSLGPCAWLDALGELVAVGEIEQDGGARVLRGFSVTSRQAPCEPLVEPP